MSNFKFKKCDNCNRMFEEGSKATLIIPEVELTGRYNNEDNKKRPKLSKDTVDFRTAKVYCKKCLNIEQYFIGFNKDVQ